MDGVGKELSNKNLGCENYFVHGHILSIWWRCCFQSTIPQALYLSTHMFFYCSCCASNVLQNMHLYVGLWVPMCFGMANDWGFFFLVVNFCHLVQKNLEIFECFWTLKNFYIWLILILKKLNLFPKLLISLKLKPKKKPC